MEILVRKIITLLVLLLPLAAEAGTCADCPQGGQIREQVSMPSLLQHQQSSCAMDMAESCVFVQPRCSLRVLRLSGGRGACVVKSVATGVNKPQQPVLLEEKCPRPSLFEFSCDYYVYSLRRIRI